MNVYPIILGFKVQHQRGKGFDYTHELILLERGLIAIRKVTSMYNMGAVRWHDMGNPDFFDCLKYCVLHDCENTSINESAEEAYKRTMQAWEKWRLNQ